MAITNSTVGIQPDSTGKKVQTFENVVGGLTVEAQAIIPVDPNTGNAIITSSALAGTEQGIIVRSVPSSSLAQLVQQGAAAALSSAWPFKLTDGVNAVGLAQGRNADNQAPQGTAWQLDVSASSGLLNMCSSASGVNVGAYDRTRATTTDGAPAAGIPAGSSQFAIPFSTTINQIGGVTANANSQVVVVTNGANVKVGDYLSVDTGANQELVFVSAVTGTNVTAIFRVNHANSVAINWFHYNVARDASAGNNIALTGLSASMTYFFNTVSGLAELERSANGELDGASGNGTAIAAEYEWNGNAPANGSVLSGLQFDRGRSLPAKGRGAGTISNNPLAVASVSLTLNSAPTTLQVGQRIILDRTGASPEVNYVASSYVFGSTTVPLQIATINSHAQNSAVEWDQASALGPGLGGFLPDGVGIEEEALWDPVSQLFYIERAATADGAGATGIVGTNVVVESPGLYNGTGSGATSQFDRGRSGSAANLSAQLSVGAEMTTLVGQWSINAQATAGTPSVSRSAVASTRHVCTSVSVTIAAGATAQTPIIINLRDGATGAGTILRTWALSAPVNGSAVLVESGLNIPGSVNTAMTIEFASASAAAVVASVNLAGYDAQ